MHAYELFTDSKADSKLIWLVGAVGVALTLAVCQWAIRLDFDFRPEVLLALLVVVQLLTSSGIQPQRLTHLLWLVPLVWPTRRYILLMSLPLIAYVIGVWMRYEAQIVGAHGISEGPFTVLALIMWLTLLAFGLRARIVMSVPGFDPVARSRAQLVG